MVKTLIQSFSCKMKTKLFNKIVILVLGSVVVHMSSCERKQLSTSADIASEPTPEPTPEPVGETEIDPSAVNEDPEGKKKHKFTNRLIKEQSPYLLQHAHNPVDWYPWGDEAFERAKKENKPILLSVGYSTCHWCHVMERESFENEEIAKIMNEHFVCVKLDREERPDVDKIYMTAVQALVGGGGWPLNVFLTPDRKPFFGGTYFPPKAAPGRPSWPDLLQNIAKVWDEKREQVIKDADNIANKLSEYVDEGKGEGGVLAEADLSMALQQFKEEYDAEFGGWGRAPKFPRPSQPSYMLQVGSRLGDKEAIDQVIFTCGKMAAGGMYDQIGGGFSRYSVDEQWLVPHFEKMLYDNAQLLQLYLDAYLITGKEHHADLARDILKYVLRDMTHPRGGFYSAEDADSEGKEGKFYCWTKDELEELLTAEEMGVVIRYYGISRSGNFEDHSDPDPIKQQNVLSIVDAELAAGEEKLLTSARDKMFKERAKRVRPGLDDKILTSWNGLMLGAIARAAAVFDNQDYLAAAEKNLAFIRSELWDAEKKRLYHRWRNGARDNAQIFDTHAYLLSGIVALYGVTLNPAHLEFSMAIADRMIEAFYDPEEGGFFQSDGAKDLILRLKEDYDGAEPSGNSVASLALLKLAAITGNKRYREVVDKTLSYFSGRMKTVAVAMPYMLKAADFAAREPNRVVIAGDPKSESAQKLLRAAHSVYQPHKVVLGTVGPIEEFARSLAKGDDKDVQVYLCKGKHCELPTADPGKVRQLLLKKE